MKQWTSWFALLALSLVCAASCSANDTDSRPGTDAAQGGEGGARDPNHVAGSTARADAGAGGSEATGSAGAGALGGGGAAAGAAGASGEGGASPSAAGAGGRTLAGDGGQGGSAGLTCAHLLAEGGVGGDPYNGAQWTDFSADECRACPGGKPVCDDFIAQPASHYDATTRVLVLEAPASMTELVSATLSYMHYSPSVDDYLMGTTMGQIAGNAITFDLSGEVAEDLLYLLGNMELVDACGDSWSIGVADAFFDLEQTETPSEYQLSCSL